MRRPLLLASTVLLLAAPAARAQTPEPVIRAGVAVAGVDVSNQTLTQAAGTINRAFYFQLVKRNVSVRVGGRPYRLRTKAIDFKFDPAKSARRAFIAGNKTPQGAVDVLPYVTYDQKKVDAFVTHVDNSARVVARNATVHIGLRHMERHSGRTGREMYEKRLQKQLAASLTDPRAPRLVRPPRKVTRPKVRMKDLRSAYGTVITVDKSNFRLRLFKRLRFVKSYGVAVGQPAYPTPTGLFHITNKAVNPTWSVPDSPWAGALRNETVAGGSAQNPLKARWMGITNGVGIHGTAETGSIGTAASHGCIRMLVPDVIDLYPRVPVGTPVLLQ
jgi:lipoprotein-anchoring transpeptidase ErfK/SrfK